MILWLAFVVLFVFAIEIIRHNRPHKCPRCNECHLPDDAFDIARRYYYTGPEYPKQRNPSDSTCSPLFVKKSCLNKYPSHFKMKA